MPKDLKNSPPPRDSRRTAHPMLLGIIIGLLMGIVIALAVALWLNRLSSPFVDKGKPIEPLAKIAPAQAPKPVDKNATAGPAGALSGAEKPATERPRFEFYTMLPGEREVKDKSAKPAAAKPQETAKTGPGSSPSRPKPHSGETCWLQAGAFAEEKDADNLKAKIAFTGLEASVMAVELPGRGSLHRVRLGPYESMDNVNQIKAVLSKNGISAATICTADTKPP